MRNIVFIIILVVFVKQGHAQDKRVELKLSGALIASWSTLNYLSNSDELTDHYSFGSAGYSIEGHYFIKPNLAIGASYTRSPKALTEEGWGDFRLIDSDGNTSFGRVEFLQYGISGKYTTSRARRFSAYATAKLYYMQRVFYDFDDLNISIGDDGLAMGIGGGVVVKVSKTFGVNLLEITYNHYLAGMDFSKDTFGSGELYMGFGFVFNFLQRK